MAILLAGCAAGPDFIAPSAPDAASYSGDALPEATPDGQQTLVVGKDIPSAWWELFHSEAVNKLVEKAVQSNPDIAAAKASLKAAEENLYISETAFVPTVKGTATSLRQQTSSASSGGMAPGMTYSLHNASVGVSYYLDVWGGVRRDVEMKQAKADLARYELEAAHLALTSNVVTAAVREASLREQIAATKEIISDQKKILEIFDAKFQAGAVAKSDVLAQKAALAEATAMLPPLEKQLAATRHALAAMLGQMPSEKLEELRLDKIELPKEIPLSLPSKLVEQRPDVKAAESNMHAASAAIGVVQAARLPSIILSADIGSVANAISKLFTPGGGFWSLGGAASQTLFDAGALAAQEDAARDAFDAAAAQYRKAVLAAFQNVADALHALQSDVETLTAKAESASAAKEAFDLAQARFDAGATGGFELLEASKAKRQADAALVQARAARYADTAALLAALGGGWWNRDVKSQPVLSENKSEKGTQ